MQTDTLPLRDLVSVGPTTLTGFELSTGYKARKVLPRLEVIMDLVLERYERICIDDSYHEAFQRISKLRLGH
jgi:hypothetical protein